MLLYTEGSFIRHKSLDSATIALSQTRTANEVSAANSSANQTLEQLINEKRKHAAEKLQRRRETDGEFIYFRQIY